MKHVGDRIVADYFVNAKRTHVDMQYFWARSLDLGMKDAMTEASFQLGATKKAILSVGKMILVLVLGMWARRVV